MPRARRALGIAAVVFTVAATFLDCTDFVAPYAPVVTDTLDHFEYAVSVNGVTTTTRYTWVTTGTAATVTLSSNVTSGTATVTINDADGSQVYSHALDGSGPAGTTSATAGEWRIAVALTNAVGMVHFTVQPQ